MQPPIQQITQKASQKNGPNDRKRQFHRKAALYGQISRILLRRRQFLRIVRFFGHLQNYFSNSSSPARSVAFTTALIKVTRSFPSSSSRMPSIVQPAGVVTASFNNAG